MAGNQPKPDPKPDDRNSIQRGVDEAGDRGHDTTDSNHSTR